jgi:ketosteroid isomerase-like protein
MAISADANRGQGNPRRGILVSVMWEQNLDVVRRLIGCFVEQDVQGALADITSDAILDWSDSDAPDRGVYEGHSRWRAFMEARDEALGARGFEVIEEVTPRADTVVLVGRVREQGRASGVEVAAQGAAVFTLRDGKVSRLKLFQTSEDAFRALDLPEQQARPK